LYCIGIYPRILDFDIYSLSRSVSPAEILSLLCLTILHQHNAHHPYTHHTQIWTLLDFNEF
jgi:5-methylcytosine-specific restriction endonuclease McrBC regulatory subunit McrC